MTTAVVTEARPRKIPFRLSVRMLMILILILGGGIGWIVYRARVQRDAVAAIRQAGGHVHYDPDYAPSIGPAGNRIPVQTRRGWPTVQRWLVELLGIDFFAAPSRVVIGSDVDDKVLAHIGRLTQLRTLVVDGNCSTTTALSHARLPRTPNSHVGRRKSAKVTRTGLEAIGGLAQLRTLDLIGIPVADGELAFLTSMTQLQALTIDGATVSDAGMAHISGLRHLRILDLDTEDVSDSGIAQLKPLVKLQLLRLGRSRITTEGLSNLRDMPALEMLVIAGSNIDDLAPIRHLTGITELALSHCPISNPGLAPIAGYRTLQRLLLEDTNVGDAGIEHLRGLPSLYRVDLAHTKITDAGLAPLTTLPALAQLVLDHTAITDSGLAQLKRAPGLRELSLADTRISDAGLGAISEYRLPMALDLSNTRITDAGLKSLSNATWTGWVRVVFKGTGVTNAGFDSLRKARPRWNVVK